MNTFVNSLKNGSAPDTQTTNGMGAHSNTGSVFVDLFSMVGASRDSVRAVIDAFERALNVDKNIAAKILLWARDVREGAGERMIPREMLKFLENRDPELLIRLLPKLPELGRFDDLLIFGNPKVKKAALSLFADALRSGSGLAAKWAPREKSANRKQALELMKFMGLSPKQYRRLIVEATNVVETKMCANKWEDINFSHVPSVAHSRYKKAFHKNAPVAYGSYVSALVKGTPGVKINAGAIFPHDVIKNAERDASTRDVIDAQWAALPNFMGDGHKALAMVDVSGSMNCSVGGLSGTTCMHVAIALGLYVSDKNSGPFKDLFLTFSTSPKFVHLTGKITDKIGQMSRANWNMTTNLEGAFDAILDHAIRNEVSAEDMPSTLLILSDMQFDVCVRGTDATNMIKQEYAAAGYSVPNVVFWNLKEYGNRPAKSSTPGVALVSGFSPAILSSVLGREIKSPYDTMMDVIGNPRYEFE